MSRPKMRAAPGQKIPPTARQLAVLRAIVRYWAAHMAPPTVRWLVTELGYGSPNAVWAHLKPLHAKGWIVWTPVKRDSGRKCAARGIVVPELLEAAKLAADSYLATMKTEARAK